MNILITGTHGNKTEISHLSIYMIFKNSFSVEIDKSKLPAIMYGGDG